MDKEQINQDLTHAHNCGGFIGHQSPSHNDTNHHVSGQNTLGKRPLMTDFYFNRPFPNYLWPLFKASPGTHLFI